MSSPPLSYHGLYYLSKNNHKTGRVIGVAVGLTVEETASSCQGCPLKKTKCYAWHGTPALGLASQHRALDRDQQRYSLDRCLARLERLRNPPRVVRFGTIGDPARIHRDELEQALEAFTRRGLAIIGYTHFWRDASNAWLREWFLASCNHLGEVSEALKLGWRPAVIVPEDFAQEKITMARGRRAVVCPYQTKGLTCTACQLCGQHGREHGKLPVILFRDERP